MSATQSRIAVVRDALAENCYRRATYLMLFVSWSYAMIGLGMWLTMEYVMAVGWATHSEVALALRPEIRSMLHFGILFAVLAGVVEALRYAEVGGDDA